MIVAGLKFHLTTTNKTVEDCCLDFSQIRGIKRNPTYLSRARKRGQHHRVLWIDVLDGAGDVLP